eukprot:6492710-Amphidinium_carterae.3
MSGLFLAALRHLGGREASVSTKTLSFAIDSGAAASVVPTSAVEGYPVIEDAHYGRAYESANGERRYDQGLVRVACDCQGRRKVLRMRKTKVKRGADEHRRDGAASTATVGVDYAYLSSTNSAAPVLVARCDLTKATFAEVLPSKGTVHPHNLMALVTQVVSMLLQLPHTKMILKSDDEESIKALKRAAAAGLRVKHGKEVMEVVAPDSASNGLAEGAARDTKAVTRALLPAASQMHGGGVIPARHAIVPWAVRHAGRALTIAQVGTDGRTAYERMWNTKSTRQLVPFSECVMQHTPGPSAEPKWEKSIYIPGLGAQRTLLYWSRRQSSDDTVDQETCTK